MQINEPISKHYNVFIVVLVCVDLVLRMNDKGGTEPISVLTLWDASEGNGAQR